MSEMCVKLMTLSAENDDKGPFQGSLNSVQSIIGIVLIITGLLIVYFGIKVYKGYKFLPETKQNIPKEDNYVPLEAKVLQKKKSTMPSFNGGEDQVLVFWKIGYQVDGEKYTQMIPDDGYQKGDMLKIKYDPADPNVYYLDEDPDVSEETQQEEPEQEEKNSSGILFSVLGVIIAVVGLVLIL